MKLLINVEAQNEDRPGYDISLRANSIERYAIYQEILTGSNPDDPGYYILNAIIINISGRHDTGSSGNE